MSVWAGATLYLRVMDGHRELYVPQGLSLDRNPQSCWKVKRDPQSNRTFFVNVAGLGKKWRLPDIYDPKNTLFLHRVDGHLATPIPNGSRRSSKPDGLALVDATPGHLSGVANNNSEPVGSLTPAAAPPDHAPTPDVSRMVPAIEEPSLLKDLDGIDMPTDFEPVARDPTADTGYGGEDDWEQMSPLGRQRLREQQEAAARARQEEARAQDAFMSKVAAREYVFEFGDPEADARTAASPERIEAEHEAAVRLAEQQARTQARTEDVQRANSRVLEETRRREQSYDRERRAVEDLERQQLEVIRAHTASLADQSSDRSPSAASERVQRTIALSAGQQHENKQWQTARSSSVASGVAAVTGHDGGPSPWALLQEQLDFHKDRSEKLRVELEDRDRVILEHKLGDAERERREIALRVRMVEAMAAFREREQLLREEEMDAQDRAVEMRSTNGRRAGSSSAPRHPLFEADLVTD